jgi:hypothetical protein
MSDTDAPAVPHIRAVIGLGVVMEAMGKDRAFVNRLANTDPDFPKFHRLGTFSVVLYADEFANYMNNLKLAKDAPVHHGGKVHLHKKQKSPPSTA